MHVIGEFDIIMYVDDTRTYTGEFRLDDDYYRADDEYTVVATHAPRTTTTTTSEYTYYAYECSVLNL